MNDDFQKELLAAFHTEAEEHLAAIGAGLQALEKTPSPPAGERAATVEAVYRDAHSLKGAARSVDLVEVGAICQAMESLFSAWKGGRLAVRERDFARIYSALDGIHTLIAAAREQVPGDLQIEEWIRPLEQLLADLPEEDTAAAAAILADAAADRDVPPPEKSLPEPATPPPAATPAENPAAAVGPSAPQHGETLRVAVDKLDRIMRQAEELLTAKQGAARQARTLRELLERMRLETKEWEKSLPELREIQRRLAAASGQTAPASETGGGRLQEAVSTYLAGFKAVTENLERVARAAEDGQRTTARMVDDLLDGVKDVLMVPAASVFQAFPRMVREIGRSLGKDVDFSITGQELEIDRRILEEMKDPMIHLLRNAVDHGIESPDLRRRRGKPERGRISVTLTQAEGRQAVITVTDDGGGIPLENLKAAAVRGGVITRTEAEGMDERAALMLMFRSSVSTSARVTDLSGRGLGMAIVQEKVERLGGRIEVTNLPGAGAGFRIVLPLSLATFRGLLVRAGGGLLALPSASVERVLRVQAADLRTVENRDALLLDGRVVPFLRLAAVLNLPGGAAVPLTGTLPAVVLGRGDRRIILAVDSMEDEQEILVKSLGRQLVRVRNVAGAAILADGQPVPVLHPQDLLASSLRCASGRTGAPAAAAPALTGGTAGSGAKRLSILVAEDSITSRMLLKNILETDGCEVHTAVDGMDAWTLLKTRTFNAVVSDVDMPRLDGFALTERIRGNAAWAALPVILVTARETREDRERGIDAGANAYVVKSSFDQSNLLAVLHSLV